MNKRSKDYIPLESEIIAEREAMHEYWKTHKDPRHDYVATYTMLGNKVTEKLYAHDIHEAEENLRKSLGNLGIYPTDIVIKFDEDGNKENS